MLFNINLNIKTIWNINLKWLISHPNKIQKLPMSSFSPKIKLMLGCCFILMHVLKFNPITSKHTRRLYKQRNFFLFGSSKLLSIIFSWLDRHQDWHHRMLHQRICNEVSHWSLNYVDIQSDYCQLAYHLFQNLKDIKSIVKTSILIHF